MAKEYKKIYIRGIGYIRSNLALSIVKKRIYSDATYDTLKYITEDIMHLTLSKDSISLLVPFDGFSKWFVDSRLFELLKQKTMDYIELKRINSIPKENKSAKQRQEEEKRRKEEEMRRNKQIMLQKIKDAEEAERRERMPKEEDMDYVSNELLKNDEVWY